MNTRNIQSVDANMKREAKVKIRQAAAVLLPMLEEAMASLSEEKPFAEVDGLPLSGDYIRSTHETLTRLLEGQPISYKALYQSITLEMLANSNAWANLRLWARRMTSN